LRIENFSLLTSHFTGLTAAVKGLMGLGWIEEPAQKGEQAKELWAWIAGNLKRTYIEFVKDALYSAN